MHTLHTTEAFILGHTPQGESSRVFRLFTKDLGYLFAHGQGVRDVRNRNRYALTTGQRSLITMVRGRETWRITGAQSLESAVSSGMAHDRLRSAQFRKLCSLCASIAPRETRHDELYHLLAQARTALLSCTEVHVRDIEALTALRMLHLLGYVAEPTRGEWPHNALSADIHEDILTWASGSRRELLALINAGIESANV